MEVVQPEAAGEESPSMEQLLADESYAPLQRGEIRRGVVIAVTPSHVVLDIHGKHEGFVQQRDLSYLDRTTREQIAVGAEFPVYVLNPEDSEGRAIVSISRGLVQSDWDRARTLLDSQEIWEGQVTGYNRGGLLLSFGRLRGFIPSSHLVGFPRSLSPDEKRQRLAGMVGRRLGVRVIEVDQRRNRLVFSERAAYREWREQQQERFLEELQEGQVVHGRVSSIQDFGAFVDLGGMEGLIHISELSWKRVKHPSEILQAGQEVDARVIRLDRERKRVSLSLLHTEADPWERIEERYTLGQLISGRVSRIVSYGAFVEVEDGVEGLVHVSELAEQRPGNPAEVVEDGEILPLRIIRIDAARRRLGLSFVRVTPGEWEEWRASHVHTEPVPAVESVVERPPSGEEVREGEQVPPVTGEVEEGGQVPPSPEEVQEGGQVPPSPEEVQEGGQAPPIAEEVREGEEALPSAEEALEDGEVPPGAEESPEGEEAPPSEAAGAEETGAEEE